MSFFIPPNSRASDANNNPLSGAGWHFFLTGTTTPAESYTTVERDTAHPHPVVADAGGKFPSIYLDPAITYRAQLKTAGGTILQDVDPYDVGAGGLFVAPLFSEAADADLPETASTQQTAGYNEPGIGQALYVVDETIDAEEFPRSAYINTGRTMRLAERTITPFMFGCVDAAGDHKGSNEEPTDNADNLEEMWDFTKRYPDKVMDFSQARGLGISRTIVLDTDLSGSHWNSAVHRIIGGRLIAMEEMDHMLWFKNKAVQCAGTWQLWGGTDAQTSSSGGYSFLKAKNGIYVTNAGTSDFGRVRAQGLRRFAFQIEKSFSSSNNNIPITAESIMAVQCGGYNDPNAGGGNGGGFGGTYASGSWNGGSGSVNQYHRMTLTPAAGVNVGDLEEGDLISFNSRASEGVIVDIVSSTATTVTVDVFPIQPERVSGTFQLMHGGALSMGGFNAANSRFGTVYNLGGGVALQNITQYCPTIGTLLAEQCQVAVQLGGGAVEGHFEGLEIGHYHYEAVGYTLIDCQTASTGCRMGGVSNMEGNSRGKLGKMRRLSPAIYSGTTFTSYKKEALEGWSIQLDGGVVNTRQGQIANEGPAGRNLGNRPDINTTGPMDLSVFGSGAAQTVTWELFIDKSIASLAQDSRTVEFGPFYGTGTDGSPGGSIIFTIATDATYPQTGITVNGTTSATIAAQSGGAILGHAVYELPASGDAGNWQIFWRTEKML